MKLPEGHLTQAEIEKMKNDFHQLHKDTFTFSLPWVPIQIINVRMTARYQGDPIRVNKIEAGTTDASAFILEMRDAYVGGEHIKMPIYDGDSLLAGIEMKGPCVIEAKTVTCVIPTGNTARVDEYGNFIVDWEG